MDKIVLKPKCDFRLRAGHPWIFSNEIVGHLKKETGEIVDVVSATGYSYGKAFYNPNSLVCGRLLNAFNFNKDTIKQRIIESLEYRKFLFPQENSYRFVYGESDLLPGLIVDKYADYLSVQFLSSGMDKLKNEIVEILLEVLPGAKGIIEKDISSHRKTEGLEEIEQMLFGEIPELVRIEENGIKLDVGLAKGQKTGYFLDQKLNRKFLQGISHGKKVLDCFCNQGGFALNAAKADAKYSLAVDISSQALELAANNAKINGFENIEFGKADVFDFLEKQSSRGERWDIIVLDPPAFTKNRKTLPKAKAGYAKINKLALRMLESGGILISSSCSHHLEEEVFLELISNEAAKLGKKLRIIFRGMQSPDHPILMSMPETNYLKFFAFQVI